MNIRIIHEPAFFDRSRRCTSTVQQPPRASRTLGLPFTLVNARSSTTISLQPQCRCEFIGCSPVAAAASKIQNTSLFKDNAGDIATFTVKQGSRARKLIVAAQKQEAMLDPNQSSYAADQASSESNNSNASFDDDPVITNKFPPQSIECQPKRWSCTIGELRPIGFDLCKLAVDSTATQNWDCMATTDLLSNERFPLKKGDRLVVLRLSRDKKWAEVRKKDGSTGWIQCDHIKTAQNYDKYPWFHGNATRLQAEVLLGSGVNGSFIVRDSESVVGQLSLSVRFNGRVYHYRINRDEHEKYYVNAEKRYSTLSDLVENHRLNADGLVCRLGLPISKPTMVYQTSNDGRLSPQRPRELKRQELILRQKLGGGQYGDVYEAYWKKNGSTVAVKKLKSETAMSLEDFLSEAAVMQMLEHPNLVKLYGVCSSEPPYFIVSEYMAYGNLTDYLKREKPSMPALLEIAVHISSAMEYLEVNRFIHRDLAARNCLVGEGNVVKVADFGLARLLREDHYDAKSGSKFPIKWTAPEGLAYSRFSNKSDVWSFGVLLWEILTHGGSPYSGINLNEVYQLLCRGYRMPIPLNCPKPVGKLMKKCWEWLPENRPTFKELHVEFVKLTKVSPTSSSYMINPASSGDRQKEFLPMNGKQTPGLPAENNVKQELTVNLETFGQHTEVLRVGNSEQIGGSGKVGQMNLRKLRNTLKRTSSNVGSTTNAKDVKTLNRLIKERQFKGLVENIRQMNVHDKSGPFGYSKKVQENSSMRPKKNNANEINGLSTSNKADVKSADESGFYEDDSKYTCFSVDALIANAERIRQKNEAKDGLTHNELKEVMGDFRELHRQFQPFLNSIDSASIRFRLREKLDILQNIVSRLSSRNLSSRRWISDGSSNDSSYSSTSSGSVRQPIMDADGILSEASVRQKKDIQQMDLTLKVIVELLAAQKKNS